MPLTPLSPRHRHCRILAALAAPILALAACEKEATQAPAPPPPRNTALAPTGPEPDPVPPATGAPAPTGEPAATGAPVPTGEPPVTGPASTSPTGPVPPAQELKTWETPTGLIIEDLRIGAGKECPPGARVVMHYRGTLADGREFDSSYRSGQPLDRSLNDLIKGWREGVPGMKVGGKRRLIVPPELGYGRRGSPPAIPPDSLLIFEIELVDVITH